MDVGIKKIYYPVEKVAIMISVFVMTLYVKIQFSLAANYNITTKIIQVLTKVRADLIEIGSYAAGVCGAICLLTLMFTKSERATEVSYAWLKRIAGCYIVLISLVAVVSFLNQFKMTS